MGGRAGKPVRKENKKLQLQVLGGGEKPSQSVPTSKIRRDRPPPAWSLHAPARSRSPAWRPERHQTCPRSGDPPLPGGERAGLDEGNRDPWDGEGRGHAPDAAGVRPIPGHTRGQQQGRHGLVEEEMVIDKLLLLRVRHALECVVPASQVAVQARQRCGEARSGSLRGHAASPGSTSSRHGPPPPHARPSLWEPTLHGPGGRPRQWPSPGPRPLSAQGWASVPREARPHLQISPQRLG